MADSLQHRTGLLKSLRITGIALAGLLVICAGLATWALNTEGGTRALLGIVRGWLPAGMDYSEVSGTIAGTLRIRNFRYHDPALGLDLTVESVVVDLAPAALLARRLHVKRAEVEGVLLSLYPPTTPAVAMPASSRDPWQAPLAMTVDEVRLVRGELRRTAAPPFQILHAELAGSWHDTSIEVRKLALASPEGTLDLTTRVGARAPKLEQLQVQFNWRVGENQWSGTLGATGVRDQLELTASLDLPVKVRLNGTLARAGMQGTRETWNAHLAVGKFDPHPLVTTEAIDTIALEMDASGDLEDLALNGVLTLGEDRIRLERLVLARREQTLQITDFKARLNSQPAALTGSASLALDGSKPASLRLAWEEVELPAAWAGAQFRCAGELAATVGMERFAVNGHARLSRARRHSALALRLDGTRGSLHIAELELTQNPGAISISGDVDLGASVRWKLDAMARAFDPSLFFEAWPGALDFDLHSNGEWPEAGPQADFKLERLAGQLRGRAISGTADVSLERDLRASGRVSLKSGNTTLDVVAAVPASRVDASLHIGALQDWRRDMTGAVSAQLASTGRWPNVEIHATVVANHVRSGSTVLGSAQLTLDARDARAPRGKVSLTASDVALAGFQFEQATVGLEGNEAAHHLKLDARGEPLSVALEASGALQRAAWSGLVEKLKLDVAKVPPLALRQPARLQVARESQSLENACLVGGDITVCVAGTRKGEVFAANYSLQALPISVLTALAAPDSQAQVEGLLEGNGEFHHSVDGTLSGTARLASTAGALAQGSGEDAMRIAYRDFRLEANLSRDVGQASIRGTLVDQGELRGALTIGVRESDPTLAGKASLELHDLAPLAWWIPQLAQLQGSGALSAEIGGTVKAPRVAFTVQARNLDVEVPLLGLHLQEGSISATYNSDGSLEADGAITSGEGTLRLTGSRAEDGGLALKLGGSKFLAANIPGARVTIAPDLELKGGLDALMLTGTVTIDDADVNLEKLSIAKSSQASSDVVVVDREQRVKARAMGITSDVRIVLGKNVKLAGFGLESTLSGELQVNERPNEPSRASGEILVAGTYEAFGRKLTIQRGRLQYAGTALDNPQLDILAERKLQDVTAKLRVTGTAQQPKLDVYTDPAMSQTDAMSYLLTGKPASDLHDEDGAMVQSAAQSVGTALGNRLAKKFGGKTGLVDEVGVEQNADLGGSAFTVGKYLSPRLFVSYGVGLFEPGNAITVRWQFAERWSLEANDTPEDQHAGVRYRIEK